MFERYELWNTRTLLAVMRETETPPSRYWRDLLFPNVLESTDEYIDLEKIPNIGRKLAPFVAPMAQGRPIFEEGSRVARFKPAYSKSLDPVTPARALVKRPGTLLLPNDTTPQGRYDAIKSDILAYHRNAAERLHEWLAAKAILDARVVIQADDYPTRIVDFGRAEGHDITLGSGSRWGDAGVSILDSIEGMMGTMFDAEFGGSPTRITVGNKVWGVMRKDPEIKDMMDLRYRGSDIDLERGILQPGEVRRAGMLGNSGLEVFVYNDWFTDKGVRSPFMQQDQILLSSPAVQGYQCFGAILDIHANFQAIPIFPRNFINVGDPAIEHILTQTAPLMVPVNPNATFRATVV